jgi:hypothetical protein
MRKSTAGGAKGTVLAFALAFGKNRKLREVSVLLIKYLSKQYLIKSWFLSPEVE